MTNQIREIRRAKGLTQEQLADAIGRDVTTINKLEKGRMKLTVDYMLKISEVLGVKAGSLLPDSDAEYTDALIPVIGWVNPGTWTECGTSSSHDPNKLAALRHRSYLECEHYAFEVCTREPNNEHPAVKRYVVCIAEGAIRPVDLTLANAVVERRYNQLASCEVRQIKNGELQPPPDEIESDDVILGVVVMTIEHLVSQSARKA